MFDRNSYCESCRELKLSRNRLEEMIDMTEEKKTTGKSRRNLRVAAVALAAAAALAVTAAASGAVEQLFGGVHIIAAATLNADGTLTSVDLPIVTMEKRGEQTFLVVEQDGKAAQEYDITDTLAAGDTYEVKLPFDEGTYVIQASEAGYQVDVYDLDGSWVTGTGTDDLDDNVSVAIINEDGTVTEPKDFVHVNLPDGIPDDMIYDGATIIYESKTAD